MANKNFCRFNIVNNKVYTESPVPTPDASDDKQRLCKAYDIKYKANAWPDGSLPTEIFINLLDFTHSDNLEEEIPSMIKHLIGCEVESFKFNLI